MHCNDCLRGNKSLDAWLNDSKRRCKDCPFPATDTLIGNCKELSKSVKIFLAFEVKILPHIQYLSCHCLPGKGEGMINIGILSSSLRQRHFQHSNLGGWIDYREISGRGLVRRCRPYMFASLSKLHPSEWEVLGFEAQHGKFPLNRQIHSFRFEMLEQILGSKLSMMQITSCVSTQENNIRSTGKELLQLHSNAFGKIQDPCSILLAGQSFFATSLKTVLIRFHVNEKAAMFVLRFGIEEKQQREQAAARRDGNSSGIREAGKPLLTSTLLPQPPKPLPSPVLELTTKLLSCFGSEIKLTCYPFSFTWWRISLKKKWRRVDFPSNLTLRQVNL